MCAASDPGCVFMRAATPAVCALLVRVPRRRGVGRTKYRPKQTAGSARALWEWGLGRGWARKGHSTRL